MTRKTAPSEAGATVRGKLCYLRPLAPRDGREWVALRSASRKHLAPFEPRSAPGFDAFGPAGFRAQLDRARQVGSDLSLIVRREDGRLLGGINVSQFVMGPYRSAYLGYWIGQPFVRRGYMTEALQLALRRSFAQLGLHRVEANILLRNAPSRALVERAGFNLEGLSRRHLKIGGRWQDHERWALLAEAWKPASKTPAITLRR